MLAQVLVAKPVAEYFGCTCAKSLAYVFGSKEKQVVMKKQMKAKYGKGGDR